MFQEIKQQSIIIKQIYSIIFLIICVDLDLPSFTPTDDMTDLRVGQSPRSMRRVNRANPAHNSCLYRGIPWKNVKNLLGNTPV